MLPQVVALAQRVNELRPHLLTEEATKNGLVMPFIQALGYNVFDPTEVIPEFIADVGIKKGEKVDYAIKHAGQIAILIECKTIGTKLDKANMSQLYRYFGVTKARIAILTNGVEYWLYSDLVEPNKMDDRPFFIFDLMEIREDHLHEIQKLSKEFYDLETMLSSATLLKHTREIKVALTHEFADPSPEFVKMLFNRVLPKERFTREAQAMFTDLVRKAIENLLRESVASRLRVALATSGDRHVNIETTAIKQEIVIAPAVEVLHTSGIETTVEELEGYHLVKAIVRQVIDPSRVIYRDTKSYMGILIDNNNRKPLCRLCFNYTQKYLGLIGEDKEEVKHEIGNLNDIFKHSEALIAAAKLHA